MELVFYTSCAYLPIHLLAYLPFFDVLRFGKGWMAATVTGNMLLHLLGVSWVVSIGRPELAAAVGGAMVPISLSLYFLNIRLSPGRLLFTYVLLVNYQIIIMGFTAFVAARAFHAPARSWESGVICLALFALGWLPMYRLFRYAVRQVYRIDAPRLWRVIWLIPATTSGVVVVLTGGLQDRLVGSWQFLISRIGLLLCVVVVYWVLLRSLEGIQKQAALQEQLSFETHLLEVQIAEQKKHSQLMVEHAERVRQQRHDLRHQLTAIRGLVGEDNAPLKEYIDGLIEDIPKGPQYYCENQAVNAVVSHYAALCKEHGVELTVRLDVPADTEQVTAAELCVIFGNLLENALEACGRMAGGGGSIRLGSDIHLDILTIAMDNSFDGQVRMENGKYCSSKREDFGVGLASIQSVARKCGGDTRFEADGSVFRSSVYLHI